MTLNEEAEDDAGTRLGPHKAGQPSGRRRVARQTAPIGKEFPAEHNRVTRAIAKLDHLGAIQRPPGRGRVVLDATPAGLALARMFDQYEETKRALTA